MKIVCVDRFYLNGKAFQYKWRNDLCLYGIENTVWILVKRFMLSSAMNENLRQEECNRFFIRM